jgi:hypothetical protein
MLWQLKKISTGETLNEPQKLPNNWGPIFGMAGIQDRLGDLSWLGAAYSDQGWFVVGEAPADLAQATASELAWDNAKALLRDSDWAVLSDVPMTAGDRALWIEYRRALREIRLQPDFPTSISWPVKPE